MQLINFLFGDIYLRYIEKYKTMQLVVSTVHDIFSIDKTHPALFSEILDNNT